MAGNRFLTHYRVTVISEIHIPTVRETQVHIHCQGCACGWEDHDEYIVMTQVGNTVTVKSSLSTIDVVRVSQRAPAKDPPPGMWPP
ncbi:MAG TPA: hypothetical protein VK454_11970 [Myxococcaceae bacterium]|nr:hypothetical protein [Myxococcaceae bacterium]